MRASRDLGIATLQGRVLELRLELTIPGEPSWLMATRIEMPEMAALARERTTLPVRVDSTRRARLEVAWS